jgi:hypothetical protein
MSSSFATGRSSRSFGLPKQERHDDLPLHASGALKEGLCGCRRARSVEPPVAFHKHITTITPKIVNGAVDLPKCASLAALIDWRAVQRLAA